MNAIGPINMHEFMTEREVRDDVLRLLFRAGVRLVTIAGVMGCTQGRVSQVATHEDRLARQAEIRRRELAVIARRLGEYQLLRSTAPGNGVDLERAGQ